MCDYRSGLTLDCCASQRRRHMPPPLPQSSHANGTRRRTRAQFPVLHTHDTQWGTLLGVTRYARVPRSVHAALGAAGMQR
jgi:hypothetical protein